MRNGWSYELLKPNNSCQFRLRLRLRLGLWRRLQRELCNIKSASKWRLPLFKSAKLKQNVARCCRLRFGLAAHPPPPSHHLHVSHSRPVGSSDYVAVLAVWFHWPDKPQGKCAAAARASSLSHTHDAYKTASKCKCCTGNCPGSCYPPPFRVLPPRTPYWFILSVNKHFNFNLCSPSFVVVATAFCCRWARKWLCCPYAWRQRRQAGAG